MILEFSDEELRQMNEIDNLMEQEVELGDIIVCQKTMRRRY
ncbi:MULTISPECIES: ryptide family R-Y-crosslinked RiPP peptide [unclassified Streptococcus]|nr:MULTISPECIES: ryptide family R-Y-crosslinked RiPP peptide [unclassified Streptococcus]